MTFTANFGVVPFQTPTGTVYVPDLTKFATVPTKFKENPAYTLQYEIKDGERLDQLSKRIYGDENRLWVIILINDMFNLSEAWPLNDAEFSIMLSQKYPFNSPSDTHHHEDDFGDIVDPYAGAYREGISPEAYMARENLTAVSINDYEAAINERKRHIRVLDPVMVEELEDSLFAAFDTSNTR